MSASLLATKFLIPPSGARRVPRPRLLNRLDDCLHHPLTLISAPAGYGKTVLMSDWARRLADSGGDRQAAAVAWVTLDDKDNDPVRFWIYLLTALDRLPTLAGALNEEFSLLQAASPPAIDSVLANLINILTERAASSLPILVLDDFHTITDPRIHDSLAFLLDHMPPPLRLVLASRADPPLSLARMRARGRLLELRANDLRFTSEEAAAFLEGKMHLRLPVEALAELEARTEGWITGLKLAALSLQGRDDTLPLTRAFTGQHPFVLQYLVEEVVCCQTEPVQSFLEQTSILERLCGPLCEAVTGQPAGDSTLSQLWRQNLFIEPIDEAGQWYRCHHLFGEALLAQLQRSRPGLIPELHRRAREWYTRNGFLDEAIHHALAGGDYDWAADRVECEYRSLIARGQLVTLRHWLESLPPQVVQSRVRSCLAYSWGLAYSGRYDELDLHLTRAETLLDGSDGHDARALRGEILALRAVIGSVRSDIAGVLETAEQALALAPADDRLVRAVAWQARGNVYRLQGRPDEARRAFEQVLGLGSAIGGSITLAASLRLGQVLVMQGRLRQAEAAFQRVVGMAGEPGGQLVLFTSEAHTRLGDIYREWNELDRALEHVLKGIELAQRGDNVMAVLTGYFTLAHVRVAQGETALARRALQEAEQLAARYDFPNLGERVACHQAWFDLVSGRVEAAAQWGRAYAARRAGAPGEGEMAVDFQDMLFARILLSQQKTAEARQALQQIIDGAGAAHRDWAVIQALALEALALRSRGQHALAAQALEQALTLAAPDGYLRLFLDEGEPLRSLIADLRLKVEATPLLGYVDWLLHAFGQEVHRLPAAGSQKATNQSLVEPLSARELEVLLLVSNGCSNSAIAQSLIISVGTVKSHINRILGKLAARNRTEAVARARTLGLL